MQSVKNLPLLRWFKEKEIVKRSFSNNAKELCDILESGDKAKDQNRLSVRSQQVAF